MNNNSKYRHRYSDFTIDFDLDDEPQAAPKQGPSAANATQPIERARQLHFVSFGSGSSGNCAYLGTPQAGLLIDAAIEPDNLFAVLEANGVNRNAVKGIILTHDHTDHVRYAYTILRSLRHLRLYCTPRLLAGILRRHNISRRIGEYHEPIHKEIPFRLAGFEITAFETSHDGTDNMGFHLLAPDGRHFVVATDTGLITERARHYISQANLLMLESDYDDHMLTVGRYPEYLKSRIRGAAGHLSNAQAAELIAQICPQHLLTHIFLCHLSKDNNTPELAITAVGNALREAGLTVGDASYAPDQLNADVQLYALPRSEPSTWFIL